MCVEIRARQLHPRREFRIQPCRSHPFADFEVHSIFLCEYMAARISVTATLRFGILGCVLAVLGMACTRDDTLPAVRDGDVIFQTSRSSQSLAIQRATGGKCEVAWSRRPSRRPILRAARLRNRQRLPSFPTTWPGSMCSGSLRSTGSLHGPVIYCA
jgi:hypothetical protein